MSVKLLPDAGQREQLSFVAIENEVRKYWAQHSIESKLKARCSTGKKFYFLDGPPYTADFRTGKLTSYLGRIHMGTAWNKLLKDTFIRYKRMNDFNVYTRPGFDMHGLPIEKATEKKLNIAGRNQIEQFGEDRFIEECRALALDNLNEMTATFKELGVWMDWDTPYMTISKEFMEGVWWLIKRIHELGRLYEGEKTLMWDAVNGTALAKHETYHANMYSVAVYVAYQLVSDVPEQFVGASLVVWTTSAWTLPFTQAVLVSPEVTYALVEVSLDGSTTAYILAKEQVDDLFLHKIKVNGYRVITTMLGKELKGLRFHLPEFGSVAGNTGLVLLTAEVNARYGSGLVPCAPSCGADDWVVAKLNGIPTLFNGLDEFGIIRNYAAFEGMKARADDLRIIDKFHEKKLVLYSHKVEHSHLFGERSKQPIVFRPTKQWFFKVEDIKTDLLNEHYSINWVPETAKNAFNAWLENLRDNSVSKQRFWGTPLPIWRNVDDASDYFVVGSAEELQQLSGETKALDDLHKSKVDTVVITRVSAKDGKSHQYKRVPDVLDVWVDAGSASWNALQDATAASKLNSEWFPIDLILEGKDQIRGWFNLLHLLSVMVNKQKSFKNCYMHGFVVDEGEDKISKSAGNFEDPTTVYAKYGVDPLRLYLIGAAAPGMDLKFSSQHLLSESKSLHALWNLHKYLLEMTTLNEIELDLSLLPKLSQEERYVLSKLNSLVNTATERMEQFKFNALPPLICEFAIKILSHWFVQTNREEMATADGSDEKKSALSTLATCLMTVVTLLAPVVPHLAEKIYQNLRAAYEYLPALKAESVHLLRWPSVDHQLIDQDLEDSIDVANDVITAILAARDKLALGVKWPCGVVHVNVAKQHAVKYHRAIEQAKDIILCRTNVKHLDFEHVPCNYGVSIKSQSGIAKQFGKKFNLVAKQIAQSQQSIVEDIQSGAKVLDIKLPNGDAVQLNVAEHLLLSALPPADYQLIESPHFSVFLSKARTPALDQEGIARECIRKVQMLRKKLALSRKQHIDLIVITDNMELKSAIKTHQKLFMERAGLSELTVTDHLVDSNEEIYEEKIQKISFKLVLRSK